MKKTISISILILFSLALSGFFIIFEDIDLKVYSSPIILEPEILSTSPWSKNLPVGIWYSEFGYFHDCWGCESMNTLQLTIAEDSSVTSIDTFREIKHLFQIPILNKFYGIPGERVHINTNEFLFRGNCLIHEPRYYAQIKYDSGLLNNEFKQLHEFYDKQVSTYNCKLEPFDVPDLVYNFKFENEVIKLTPIIF